MEESRVLLVWRAENKTRVCPSVCQSPGNDSEFGTGTGSTNIRIRVWSTQSVIGPTNIHPPARTQPNSAGAERSEIHTRMRMRTQHLPQTNSSALRLISVPHQRTLPLTKCWDESFNMSRTPDKDRYLIKLPFTCGTVSNKTYSHEANNLNVPAWGVDMWTADKIKMRWHWK